MSLITIDRSLFASDADSPRNIDGSDALDSSSRSSQSEDFLMCKATAVGLNIRSRRRSSCIKPNDDIQDHLKKILHILRFGDYLQLVVRLQSDFPRPHHHRYCCVISTTGKQGTEESAILGVDLTDRRATIGLVLPIWQDMSVKLFGDGGFELITKDTEKQFKPVSVQALWAAFQSVNRACQVARTNDYFSRGLTHDWVSYYHNLPASDTHQIQEWLKTDDIDGFNRYTLPSPLSEDATEEEKERHRMESLIRVKLQEIMYSVDLEEVTVLQLRERLEDVLGQQLRDYRHFIEEEVLTIYGRMDEASEIFDHLLLGTTFNASNRAELERRSVTHILNVTREVDNFFPGEKFEYKNIRVFDDEQSSLLPYFEDTHRFINEAKAQGTCCLVHCKMGISRSATTVIAYAMKEQNWDLDTALAYVKSRRPCVQPNAGFMRELRTYQGILEASSNRHKPIFCKDAHFLVSRLPAASAVAPVPPVAVDEPATGQSPASNPPPFPSPPGVSSNAHSDVCRTPTPTPGPVAPDNTSTGSEVTVDLEAELFAFKPPTTTLVGACLLAMDNLNPSSPSGLERSTATVEKRPNRNSLQSDAPIIVWDLQPGVQPRRTQSDRTTLLARNSHCLRQWHPDLVENVGFTDTTEFVPPSSPSSSLCEVPGLCYSEVQFLLPYKSEDLIDTLEWSTVCCCEADNLSTVDLSDPHLTDRCCVVRTEDCSRRVMLATVSKPVLKYTGVQEQLVAAVPSRKSSSSVTEAGSSPIPNSNLSYVLRMAPRLKDVTPVQADITCVPEPKEFPVTTCTHVTPQMAIQASTDRRRTATEITLSTTSFPTQPAELCSSFPPSFSRSHIDASTVSSTVIPSIQEPTLRATVSNSSALSKLSLPSTAAASPSMFRSVRLPSRTGLSSPINRTQSARITVTQRLRPDNSWIVYQSGNTEDAATTEQVLPSARRTRPISAVCSGSNSEGNSSIYNQDSNDGGSSLIGPFKCVSIVSGSAAHTQPSALKSTPIEQSHKTLQLSTSPRVAPVSVERLHLPRSNLMLPDNRTTQPDCPSSVPNTVSSTTGAVTKSLSCLNVINSAMKDNERSSSTSRDCSETQSYVNSFRPVRRIVNWPPKTADPVATKS